MFQVLTWSRLGFNREEPVILNLDSTIPPKNRFVTFEIWACLEIEPKIKCVIISVPFFMAVLYGGKCPILGHTHLLKRNLDFMNQKLGWTTTRHHDVRSILQILLTTTYDCRGPHNYFFLRWLVLFYACGEPGNSHGWWHRILYTITSPLPTHY